MVVAFPDTMDLRCRGVCGRSGYDGLVTVGWKECMLSSMWMVCVSQKKWLGRVTTWLHGAGEWM